MDEPIIEYHPESAVSPDPPSRRDEGLSVKVLEPKQGNIVEVRKGEDMGNLDAKKVIDYALSQIGTAEDPLGSNKQKYGALIDSVDWYLRKEGDKTWKHLVNGYDWCTQFVDASFITTYGIDNARKMLFRPFYNDYASVVKYAYNYFKSAGQGFVKEAYDPKPGDVIYFQNSKGLSHTGIVVEVTDTKVITVEGNSGNNCYYVAKSTYSKTYDKIYGYGHPAFDAPEPGPEELDGYKVGNTYEVMYDDLQIRKGPGTSYDSVGSLITGDKVVCEELTSDGSGNTWMKHKTGWSCAHQGSKRYIDKVTKTGWVKENGKWYYYDQNGYLVKEDWVKYKGEWYYMGADGVMVTGWKTISEKRYYFHDDGSMAQDEWVDGQFISMNGTCSYKYGGEWKSDNRGKWFEDASGWYPRGRSVMIDGKTYSFDDKGYVK